MELSKEKLNEYSESLKNDGFVWVKSLFDSKEISKIDEAIEANIKSPSPFGKTIRSENNGEFFMDFNNWKRLKLVREVCESKKLVRLVKQLTNSEKCWLFHDHVLVKNGNAQSTPIHHDRPYYIFKGNLNLSVWITTTDIEKSSSLVYYKGSHKSNKLFLPRSFKDGEVIEYKNSHGFEFINDDNFNDYEKVSFDMKAGDAIVFFHNTVHKARSHNSKQIRKALSVRYLLDGATMTKKYVNATPPFDRMGVDVIEDAPVPEKFFPLLKG